MKRLCILLAGLFVWLSSSAARPPRDTLSLVFSDSLTNEYLDTVNLNKKILINDYSMIGAQYGVSFNRTLFNPTKNETFLFQPVNFGVLYTRYGKMFGYMPYFGFQVGAFFGRDGYNTKANREGVRPHVDGADVAVIDYLEFPAMAHMHVDIGRFKLMANLGIYGGYRLKIHRTLAEDWVNYTFNVTEEYKPAEPEDKRWGKDFAIKDYTDKFYPFENRFDYGVKGGAGVALMFDPVEFHLTLGVRWGWSSFYQQNYYSPYYYRFAYPLDFIVSFGVHFQLTKRTGKTSAQLRREARQLVYPEEYQDNTTVNMQYENNTGKGR
ncbi:MAG: outer membrane beta-barrel protein [Bacteroidales bacterium]|nr:outer membrane beta-barrel protein [Bacteroidales bacterium]